MTDPTTPAPEGEPSATQTCYICTGCGGLTVASGLCAICASEPPAQSLSKGTTEGKQTCTCDVAPISLCSVHSKPMPQFPDMSHETFLLMKAALESEMTSKAALQRENEKLREKYDRVNESSAENHRQATTLEARVDELEVERERLCMAVLFGAKPCEDEPLESNAVFQCVATLRAELENAERASGHHIKMAEQSFNESAAATTRAEAAEKERDALADWKESALREWPDLQPIGKLLGVSLGKAIGPEIVPGIQRLLALVETCRKALEEVAHIDDLTERGRDNSEIRVKQAVSIAETALAALPVAGTEGGK